jgi:hypothetical protein
MEVRCLKQPVSGLATSSLEQLSIYKKIRLGGPNLLIRAF